MKLDDFLKVKKVRCVDGVAGITTGKVYDVIGLDKTFIHVTDDNGEEAYYWYGRFELVLDSAENPIQDVESTPEFEAVEPVSEPLADTLKWFELAVPEPTIENICVQFGCDLEEQSEILRACNLPSLAEEVESYANDFKAKKTWCMNAINLIDKTELLDGLIDRQVTGLGLGYMLKMNMIAAANEVNRSNFSKFENGKPVFDDNGKIKKGANYTPPQLGEFV